MDNGKICSPTRSSVAATKQAINRLKNESPKMKDVLREKCRQRIKRERLKIMDQSRNLDSVKDIMYNIWLEELERLNCHQDFNLDEELQLEEELDAELLREHEQWLDQETEELLADEESPVVCPACCKGLFHQNKNTVICGECQIPFPSYKSLTALRADINQALGEHNNDCQYSLSCTAIPNSTGFDSANLCFICTHCNFMNVIL